MREPEAAAAALRRSFDEAFMRPREAPAAEAEEELLAVRGGGARLVLRLADLGGLNRCPRITPLPGGASALLGIGALRGALVALYDLAALAAGSGSDRGGAWMVTCGGEPSLGLVFDDLEGHLRAPARLLQEGAAGDAGTFSRIVHIGGASRHLVNVPALAEALARRGTASGEEPEGEGSKKK